MEAAATRSLTVEDLGLREYRAVWEYQRSLQADLIAGRIGDRLLVCSHHPVITVGKSGSAANVIASPEALAAAGIELLEVERGGDVTFHGPGQIVLYPIINLGLIRRDVGWYMRSLEQSAILALNSLNIEAFRVDGKTGVWTGKTQSDMRFSPRKIASLGVRISRWCTMHGISVNIFPCDGFSLINPCGLKDVTITSIQEEMCREADGKSVLPALATDFQARIIESFLTVFAYTKMEKRDGSALVLRNAAIQEID